MTADMKRWMEEAFGQLEEENRCIGSSCEVFEDTVDECNIPLKEKLQIHKLEPWQYLHEQMEDPEIFCSMFREFMALLYSDDVPYGYLSIMTNVVEGALDLYLGRHNISIYGNGNNMKDAVIYIRKAMEKTNMLYGM